MVRSDAELNELMYELYEKEEVCRVRSTSKNSKKPSE